MQHVSTVVSPRQMSNRHSGSENFIINTLFVDVGHYKNRKIHPTRLHWTRAITDRIAIDASGPFKNIICILPRSNSIDDNIVRLFLGTAVRTLFEQNQTIFEPNDFSLNLNVICRLRRFYGPIQISINITHSAIRSFYKNVLIIYFNCLSSIRCCLGKKRSCILETSTGWKHGKSNTKRIVKNVDNCFSFFITYYFKYFLSRERVCVFTDDVIPAFDWHNRCRP